MQAGFLIAGNDVHHVAHVMPVAQELARALPEWRINILTTGKGIADEVDRLSLTTGRQLPHVRMVPRQRLRGVARDPKAVMLETEVLPSMNALIVTRANGPFADEAARDRATKLIFMLPRGDDHARLDSGWAEYDHILVAGQRDRARLARIEGIDADRVSVVGCPAFEAPAQPIEPPFAGDGRKIILYSPHHASGISSWHRWGPTILDWFVEHDDYLLIFAPHPRLFEHHFIRAEGRLLPMSVKRLEDRYLLAPNIHVDLGGDRSRSRAYARFAHIYLGDAGELLREFIARPRPCLFVKAHGLSSDAAGCLVDWQAGYVIDDPRLLRSHLHTAQEWHSDVYRSVQQEMFSQSISITEIPAARRAASVIGNVIGA